MSLDKVMNAANTLNLNLAGIKLIEASAGTGKTYTICNLYCRFVMQGEEVKNILLVTFTNAATDELKHRIRQRLKDTYQILKQERTVDDEFLSLLNQQFLKLDENQQQLQLQRLKLALRCFDESAIHTINGFCQRMLSDYAFYSHQNYELNLLKSEDELWDNALKDWWRKNTYELSNNHYSLFSASIKNFEFIQKNSRSAKPKYQQTISPNNIPSLEQLYSQFDELLLEIESFKTLWTIKKEEIFSFFKNNNIFHKSSKFYFEKFEVMWPQLEQLLTASNQSVLDNSFTLLLKSEIDSKTAKAQLGKHDFLDDDIFTLADELWALQQQITKNFTASVLRDVVVFATDQVERVKLQQQSLTYDDQMLRLHQALTLGDDFLATTICKKFPVVLIDEFQDTNAIQYEIFKTIYYQKNEISLILIGDPKQAIYSFRGGDVFTYMQAKTDVNDEIYTLNTNWRSTQRLISGLNYFFNHRDDTFIYSDAMPYDDVVAGSDKELSLLVNQQIEAPISIWDVPEDLQTNEASELINSELANTVANLLNRANKGEVNIGENSVKPADIAILVRTNNEGLAIAKALKERGINSINIGKDKVLQSEAAKGLLLFLKGIAQANDHQQVRNMLASPLIALNPTQINSIINIEIEWLNWLTNVKQLNEIWQKEGFIVMFQAMLNTLKITTNILLKVDAERQMTNMLHCSELLQKESKTHATPEALCYWLQSQIRANKNELNNQSDEHELRLDSDAELVKIVTVHKSKGLEYSIVFVPYLWRCKPIGGKEPVYNYHDEQQNNVLDFAIAGSTQAQLYNDKERLAEDMRLLYVALTRAKSKLYIVTNRKIKTSYQSALNFLLHPYQSATSLNTQLANINKLKEKNILKQDLIDFVEQSEKLIDITQLEPSKTIKLNSKSTLEANNIQVKTFTGDIYFDWTISSFSRMTRDIHQVAHGGKKEVTNDAILNFKGSGEVGTFLHLILEHLDFSADIKQQTSALFDQYAPQYHLVEESTKGIVVNWLDDVIHCALNESGFCLADLSPNHCLDELEFDFSIKYMNIQKLNAYLEQRTGQNQSLLLSNNFKGMMTGFVDLIFVKDNQYYVVDYKSNFLGTSLSDYTQEKLNQAIIDRRYDLQYLIYSLALHRFLRLRIKDYQYEKHFGGVYYLFLRAMRKSSGAKFGVFFDKPTAEEINLLDEVIFECV